MNNKVKKSIRVGAGFALCLMIITTACGQQKEDVGPGGERTEIEDLSETRGDSDDEMIALPEQETAVIGAETDNGSENAEAENPDEDSEEADQETGGECFPYDYYEANEPWVIAEVEEGKEFIGSFLPIRGLIGYSPESYRPGGIHGYRKDREVIIGENVGKGLFQSERLAVVREEIKNMFIDIIRGRGEGAEEYLEYFASPALLEAMRFFLETELAEDWILLQAPYLDNYAGNTIEILYQSGDGWYDDYAGTIDQIVWLGGSRWDNGNNEVVIQPAETDTHYYFAYYFNADYRAMEYGKYDDAIFLKFSCSVSKETGLIDELNISHRYLCRHDAETLRWDYNYGC